MNLNPRHIVPIGISATLGFCALALSVHHVALGAVLVMVSAGFMYVINRRWVPPVTLIAIGVLSWNFGFWNFSQRPESNTMVETRGGQYTARSQDVFGLVTVTAVIRQSSDSGPIMIYAEATAPPFSGIDGETLKRELARALVGQRVPPKVDERSHAPTANLVHGALALILNGRIHRKQLTPPPGAWSPTGRVQDYWELFPDEFEHSCNFARMADGTFEGQSSSPQGGLTAAVHIKSGRLTDVNVISPALESRTQDIVDDLAAQMVSENKSDIDAMSGATITSLMLRSAVHYACRNNGGGTAEN